MKINVTFMVYDQLSIIQAFFLQTWCVTRMYSYVTRMYSYVTRMYLYVTRIYTVTRIYMIEVSLQIFIELPLIIIIIIIIIIIKNF